MYLLGYKTKQFKRKDGTEATSTKCFLGSLINKDGKGYYPSISADLPVDYDTESLQIGVDYIVELYDHKYIDTTTGQQYTFKKITRMVLAWKNKNLN